jgi:hypothetical protein
MRRLTCLIFFFRTEPLLVDPCFSFKDEQRRLFLFDCRLDSLLLSTRIARPRTVYVCVPEPPLPRNVFKSDSPVLRSRRCRYVFGAVNFARSPQSATLTLSERSGVGFLVRWYAEVFFGSCRQLRCSKPTRLLI